MVAPSCEVEPEARWVHGITDAELAHAPPLAEVLPRLLEVTAGKTVLAYNAEFDHDVIGRHAGRDGLARPTSATLGHLVVPDGPPLRLGTRAPLAAPRRRAPGAWRLRTAYELLCAMTAPSRTPESDGPADDHQGPASSSTTWLSC
ncbi:exonuclease domain-containing protein [Micromonospora sp. WMMD737]|uniref:3'-5' exonuclease n=1 Tax=Micromonospora sp. WMMD737 TaxID=3404113 RepID=UPI003B93B2A2